MIMLQGQAPPAPPIPAPAFDPNLIFMNDGGPPTVLLIVIAALTAMTIVLWPIMRAFGRRLEGRGNVDSVLRAEVEQLHASLAEVDALRQEVAELHERVDFTERLLAQAQHPARVGAPPEEGGR